MFAAAQIYNMLMEYKGDVTVKVDALAASAASVIAMAGTEVLMSPVGMMMIHNPMTIAIGDSKEMRPPTPYPSPNLPYFPLHAEPRPQTQVPPPSSH